MSSATHALTTGTTPTSTTRRTLFTQVGTLPAIGLAGVAIAAPINRTELAALVHLWNEACAAWKVELQIDEKSEATAATYEVWSGLEDRIFCTPSQSADDLQLKIDFYCREVSSDDEWLTSIFADVERMLVVGDRA